MRKTSPLLLFLLIVVVVSFVTIYFRVNYNILLDRLDAPYKNNPATNTITQSFEYTNEDYNFKFSLPDNSYFSYEPVFEKLENGAASLILYSTYLDSESENHMDIKVFQEYLIIPVDDSNMKSLKTYWENKIKGNFNIPVYNNYELKENFLPYANCFDDMNWQVPLSLTITEVPDVPDMPNQQMYLYYDFGKPFILYHSASGGACGWELAPYIQGLHN